MRGLLKRSVDKFRLPPAARAIYKSDHEDPLGEDPGPQKAVEAMADWLCRAQDYSPSKDGGVSRGYSLIHGWQTSYPETTGYIIPTMLTLSKLFNRNDLQKRAQKMLDWFVEIQLDGGGYQGGKIDAEPVVPVTFNTGQILIGLSAGVSEFDSYHENMHHSARFLRDSLDRDGCWRKFPTPFARPGEKAYETHVAWGLFEADRVAPGNGYGEAAMRQIRWALSKQENNGWVKDCCLNQPETPLTHTLGYFLRGILEAHKWSGETGILERALLTADGIVSAQRADGSLPGRLNSDWTPSVTWSCLTGNVQVAACCFELAKITGRNDLWGAACKANAYVRRTILFEGPPDIIGGVKGSHPVDGDYGAYEYLNWAAKFSIDSNILELR